MAGQIIVSKDKTLDQQIEGNDVIILVVGDERCGKTQFIETFASKIGNEIPDTNLVESGIVYSAMFLIDSVWRDFKIVEILGVDELLVHLITQEFDDSNAIIFMYAIDDPSGFEALPEKWITSLEENGCKTSQPCILIGNKKDLREDQQAIQRLAQDGLTPVTRQQGENVRDVRRLQNFFEISSIDENDPIIPEAFSFILDSAYQHWRDVNGITEG